MICPVCESAARHILVGPFFNIDAAPTYRWRVECDNYHAGPVKDTQLDATTAFHQRFASHEVAS